MGGKEKVFPFEVAHWMNDPAVNLLRLPTRAIWFDALCVMFNLGSTGVLEGSVADLATLCRCKTHELRAALDDLRLRDAADVTESNDGIVTLCNRRMRRKHDDRKLNRDKVKRHREKIRNLNVTEKNNSTVTGSTPPPDGFPLKPSSLSPSPVNSPGREAEIRQATELAAARTFAVNWLTVHHPNWLRKVSSFIDLIQALGQDKAVHEAEIAIAQTSGNSGIRDPFAYCLPAAVDRLAGNRKPQRQSQYPRTRERSAVAVDGREDN